MKTCNKCSDVKADEEFSRHSGYPDGRRKICKTCCNAAKASYLAARPKRACTEKDRQRAKAYSAANKEKCAAYNREYRERNKERLSEKSKERAKNNKEAILERKRAWAKSNPDKIKASEERRRQNNPEAIRSAKSRYMRKKYSTVEGRLNSRVSAHIRGVLKSGKGGRKTEELLGWKFQDLRRHLERQFHTGMSWQNMGEWHIDHITPLSSFEINGPDCQELRAAWALPNLRPLWARVNLVKGARREFLI